MELRHLLSLEAVLATGSFTAAATARHLSQPALWAQVKELERELGVQLFRRAGRGVLPTPGCLALRPRLALALREVEEVGRLASEIRDGAAVPACIGCAPSHIAHFLAGCLAEVRERNPRAPLPVVVPVTARDAVETLFHGRADLVVAPRPRGAPRGLAASKLYDIHIVALGPRATGAALQFEALGDTPIATLPRDSQVREELEALARRRGVRLRVVYELRDWGALRALARAGLCTALVPDEMLHEVDAPMTSQVTVDGQPLQQGLWLMWQRNNSLSPATVELREVMLQRGSRQASRPKTRSKV